MARVNVKVHGVTVNTIEIHNAAADDPRCIAYVRGIAEEIENTAIGVFLASQRSDNENRLSETTPPKYVQSFRNEKVKRLVGLAWRITNDDPGAAWVEYGAHAGGKTFVLKYRPFGRAIDIVAAKNL